MPAHSDTQWYVQDGASRRGPFTSAEFKNLASYGRILHEHMVWRTGLQTWVPAGSIPGLFPKSLSDAGADRPPTPRPASNSRRWIAILVGLTVSGAVVLGAALFLSQQEHVWEDLTTAHEDVL